MADLSIIIPTLNEAEHLPNLLDVLNRQTRSPDEIIVADAGSTDATVDLASERNARVVRGGLPGVGRNAGARAAQGDTFLFLDADVLPNLDFIELALDEFKRGEYGVATCPIEALSSSIGDRVLIDATNLYIQIIMSISPRAPGFCIFSRRDIHQMIGGFDETLKLSEDHDYVRRATKHGNFGLLTSTRIPVSMRRLEKEGLVGLALKYMWCEMYALAGKPIRAMPFKYEFGTFQHIESNERRFYIDITELRNRLGKIENPITQLSSAGRKQLRRIAESDPIKIASTPIRLLLERYDLDLLEQYLQARLTMLREHRNMLTQWAKRKHIPREFIQAQDINWLPSIFHSDKPNDENTNS